MKTIDALTFRKLFLDGANNLSNNKEYINELNVFPVPDGDTGTNMTLTIMAAAADVRSQENPTIDSLAKAISGGSLRGARGNSGVILSQLFRGFCKEIRGKKELNLIDLASGFERAVETAYKAVMKPKEGTILTVAKGMAERAAEFVQMDEERTVLEFLEDVVAYGEEVLEHTPELLPVLAEAGVVDSGGQGLVEIMRGILIGLKGGTVEASGTEPVRLARGAGLLEDVPKARPVYHTGSGNDSISTADIKYTYCTEFIILLEKELPEEEVERFKEYLLSIGDSLVCVADEELVKVHIHTNHPGNAFERGLTYGQLTRMKIDNMREEHSERVMMEQERFASSAAQEKEFKEIRLERKKTGNADQENKTVRPAKEYGFVAVAAGEGMAKIFREIGTDRVLSGGQTMNPSTEDILSEADMVNAKTVFILPNNKNIILAADQAARICKDKRLVVIPTKTVPQGISAMLAFNEGTDIEGNRAEMSQAAEAVRTGEVTFSVRDTSVDGKTILKGDIMGINDSGIYSVGSDIFKVTEKLIDGMTDEDTGLVTVYYGEDTKQEDAEKLFGDLQEKYPEVEFELHAGGQPLYYYIISVE